MSYSKMQIDSFNREGVKIIDGHLLKFILRYNDKLFLVISAFKFLSNEVDSQKKEIRLIDWTAWKCYLIYTLLTILT